MRITYGAKALILLAFIASLLSFAKFDHCYNTDWATPDVYTHACYSDISALYGSRGLITHSWPYSSATNAVEYPPLTGVVMWATSLLTPQGNNNYRYYFLINIFLIALLFIITSLIVAKINPTYWYLFPILPAVIASLYINWDLWSVVTAVASVYYFDKKKLELSALLLGISIATKFFPIVLLAPALVIFLKQNERRKGLRYLFISIGTAIVINLPFALTTPHGWFRFFSLNGARGADFGSLWYALSLLGINVHSTNLASLALFLLAISFFGLFLWRLKYTPTLAQTAFIAVAIFTTSSKVYSPQYTLWLAPLAVFALTRKELRPGFWLWQGSEVLYHLAIWEYLASYSGSHFGLPQTPYAIATLFRVVATSYFAWKIGQINLESPDLSPEGELHTGDEFPLHA